MVFAHLVAWTYNLMLLGGSAFTAFWISRKPTALRILGSIFALGASGLALATSLGGEPFLIMRLLSYLLFLHLPLLLLVCGVLLWWRRTAAALACTLSAGFLWAVAADAFIVEPHWLDVTVIPLPTEKLISPIRVAIVADLQTDHFGEYERRVLADCLAAQPDLILLAGDYVQVDSTESWRSLHRELNEYLHEIDFRAPLGVFAVKGNTDSPDWQRLFDGLPIERIEQTQTVTAGPLRVTGLEVMDSFDRNLHVKAESVFHIVLGHAPDFALGNIHADLLVAGHTHGGQVCLPWIGPLMTASQVPRSWAQGVTRLSRDRTLIVSRGIGMERRYAPRLRFLCRPELVLVDLVPSPEHVVTK